METKFPEMIIKKSDLIILREKNENQQLGQNGLEVSAISLGCMNFTGFYGPTTSRRALPVLMQHGITA
ncbi:MAG: hypothetical protein CM1200mP30_10030 [Pseudomonadota bacterium]|nr:MAG: hypothetical protein CM1200mP30_10030 [Pseudomonadota bacterium]